MTTTATMKEILRPHIKSTIVGISKAVMVEEGRLALGTWQSIFYCEFDGPRDRRYSLK